MNNDLISRSELKAEFQAILDRGDMFCEYDIVGMVDDAPTVEPFEPDYVGAERLKARQRGYEEGYHMGMKIGKTLNPKINHGKWIITEHLQGDIKETWYECSECKWDNALLIPRNYCPNCGADMRKEAEK